MTIPSKSGLLIAAPASGSGKTVITLALLRALSNSGLGICGAKAGPDYIDPAFHALACGMASVNLDPWAMSVDRCRELVTAQPGSHILIEGMMGLFDGTAGGVGAPADLAKALDVPVVLVVDAARQSHSVAALVRGFRDHDPDLRIAGVILNRVGSARHEAMLRDALSMIRVSVLGAVPRNPALALPERHLGLVQAGEVEDIEKAIEEAASIVAACCDMGQIASTFGALSLDHDMPKVLPPLGQHIAVARDEAFSFLYPHLLADWKKAGAQVSYFSPLADEVPGEGADAIFLPGGYPELHGDKLAAANSFRRAMRQCASKDVLIYGECGGYMVLGEGLVDEKGKRHEMLGLLNLETSFETRKLHLGYRKIHADDFILGSRLNGHEFHYSSVITEIGQPLFVVSDSSGNPLGNAGLRKGYTFGSYMHVIDRAEY